MKREEKNQKSLQEILNAAMAEFSQVPYAEVSLNSICSRHNISKGLFYHYCSGKDELFLLCVKTVFDALAEHLRQSAAQSPQEPADAINWYFRQRSLFFEQNPSFQKIFLFAMYQCPAHLKQQVAAMRAPLSEVNLSFLRSICSQMELREGITPAEAERYCQHFEEIFSLLLSRYAEQQPTGTHPEPLVRMLLDRMLFGIARQP